MALVHTTPGTRSSTRSWVGRFWAGCLVAATVLTACSRSPGEPGAGQESRSRVERDRALPTDDPAIELWLGGDVHLGTATTDVLAPLRSLLENASGIVNLEGPLGPDAAASTQERLSNAPAALALLARHGVRVIGTANNHAHDLGAHGLEQTWEAIRAAGLVPAPGLMQATGPALPALIEQGKLSVAVVAAYVTVEDDMAASLAQAVASERARARVVIASLHVLGPPSYLPRPELRRAVDAAVSAGAAIVVAHGTHAIGPVERRDKAVIAWGLGNLAFACDCTAEQDGLVLRVTVTRDGVQSAAAIPIGAGLRGQASVPARDPELMFDLLEALGSSALMRAGDRAYF